MGDPVAITALTPTAHRPWRAYARILLRRRRGVPDDGPLPVIGRATGTVKLDARWLTQYRSLIGLPDEPAVLPPLALQLAAAPLHLEILSDAHFPFPALGLVHVAQRIDQVSAVLPGTLLQIDAFTGRSRPAKSGTYLELVTEARRDGHLVWRSITTVLARQGRRPRASSDPLAAAFAATAQQPTGDWRRIELMAVAEDLGRRYAAIALDWNPIHQRAWLARRFGFDRAIVHGTWTLARAMVSAGWPGHDAFSLQATFRKPVALPSTVAVWIHAEPPVQSLRVTDADGTIEHLDARLEPALARDG